MSLPRSLAAAVLCALLAASSPSAGVVRGGGARPVTLLAAGDVASCTSNGDEQTARLGTRLPGRIALLGDLAYPNGTRSDFARCFDPSWGKLVPRVLVAALGNHEYNSGTAAAAIARFHLPHDGWKSVDYGGWHIVVLNSNCSEVGGCGVGSPQWRWLKADLARHPALCTLALWHHPRFSSGFHGSNPTYQPFWKLLAAAKAEIVLSGHDHDYERFAPIQGIRQFVVGTGGASQYPILLPLRRSRAHANAFGLLRLTLRPTGYSWRFVATPGTDFSDSGSARCH